MKKAKITIGLQNYTGAACGFGFTKSVCVADIDTAVATRQLMRLRAIYPKTTVEELLVEKKEREPVPKQVAGAPPPAAVAEASAPSVKRKRRTHVRANASVPVPIPAHRRKVLRIEPGGAKVEEPAL
jgi:hypothetical protein